MEEGGLDGGFFVIYTRAGRADAGGLCRRRATRRLVRAAAIRRVIGENRDRIGLALTADDAERLHREGRRIAFISRWRIAGRSARICRLLTTFHRLGLRMAGPVHSRTNQLADSAPPARRAGTACRRSAGNGWRR